MTEQTALRTVRVTAWVALGVVVAGVVLSKSRPYDELGARYYQSAAVIAVGILLAAGCLWHGARHAHERGRRVAAIAVFVGLAAGAIFLGIPSVIDRGPPGVGGITRPGS